MVLIATKHITNCSGMGIVDIEYGIDDIVKFIYFSTDGQVGRIRRAKIRETTAGRSYFISHGVRQYLDEFMRV